MKRVKIAITGNAGAGKSLVAKYFVERGAKLVDADRVAHEVLKDPEVKAKVTEAFGNEILSADGEIDRKKLGKRVFQNPDALKTLERIVKPKIAFQIGREMSRAGAGMVVVDAALIFEYGLAELFDVIITVVSDPELMARRLARRTGYDLDTAKKILAAQMPQEEKAARSDYVIDNRGSLEDLRRQAERVIEDIRRKWGL